MEGLGTEFGNYYYNNGEFLLIWKSVHQIWTLRLGSSSMKYTIQLSTTGSVYPGWNLYDPMLRAAPPRVCATATKHHHRLHPEGHGQLLGLDTHLRGMGKLSLWVWVSVCVIVRVCQEWEWGVKGEGVSGRSESRKQWGIPD